jgi:hypothetical protein
MPVMSSAQANVNLRVEIDQLRYMIYILDCFAVTPGSLLPVTYPYYGYEWPSKEADGIQLVARLKDQLANTKLQDKAMFEKHPAYLRFLALAGLD